MPFNPDGTFSSRFYVHSIDKSPFYKVVDRLGEINLGINEIEKGFTFRQAWSLCHLSNGIYDPTYIDSYWGKIVSSDIKNYLPEYKKI